MYDDHPSQFATLIAGSVRLSLAPIPAQPSNCFSLAPVVARRVQRRATEAYWELLSNLLIQHGTSISLDGIDYDPDECCWLIHFQASDPRMVASIHKAAM